jgi:FkbM family methyltransferase
MGPRPAAVRPRLTLRYLVQAELNYFLEEAARGGLPSIVRSWVRKVREALLWRVRCGTGGGDGPVVAVPAGQLAVNPDDLGISRELLVYGSHEPAATRLLEDFLEPGMTVLDVGANLGYFVLQEKRIIGEEGRIVAIEPAPRNVTLLRRNLAANRLGGVDLVAGAIGDYDGPGWLYLSNRSNWHSMTPSDRSQSDAVRVDVTRIDTLVERLGLARVDFVRMDLEGYETSVVQGMLRTLRDFRPKLAMELHPQKAGVGPILDLLRVLRSFDYELRWVVHRRLDFVWHPGRAQAVESMSLSEYVRSDQLLREGRTVTAFLEPRRQEA